MTLFHARDLAPILQKRDQKPTGLYDQILERIMTRIKVVAGQGATHCFYEVPKFLPGFPLLDVRACAAYLIVKLKRLDFQVQYFPTGHLWIGWGHVATPAPKPAVPALPAPAASKPRPPPLPGLEDAERPVAKSDAVRSLQKIYDEASIDVLTRLAPRGPPKSL